MLIKNRFGRIVDVTVQLADEMVKKGEGEIVNQAPPVKEKISELECQYCGKVCVSAFGLSVHQRKCKKKVL